MVEGNVVEGSGLGGCGSGVRAFAPPPTHLFRMLVVFLRLLHVLKNLANELAHGTDEGNVLRGSHNRGHAGDNSLQNHWSQIVAAIMSSEQKYLPDTAKDGVRINSDIIVS